MEDCAALMTDNPEKNRGTWRALMPSCRELRLEIGCGKGRFVLESAKAEPEVLFVALEKEQSAMVMAMEKVADAGLENIVFIDGDAARLSAMFAPGEVDLIYLNFSDPWPKSRDAKFRLTAPSFLRSYADVLKPKGELRIKTDNTPLFVWSVEQLEDEGWELKDITNDLHRNGPSEIMTDYEARFYATGIRINKVVAIKTSNTKNTTAGEAKRPRNASLKFMEDIPYPDNTRAAHEADTSFLEDKT